MEPYYVQFKEITKIYPGTIACSKVTIGFKRGEVHALLGENGAGKSTLMNVLYGLAKPDEGCILFDGKETVIDSPKVAIEHGIGMVHQHFMLIHSLTVVENIILSLDSQRGMLLNTKQAAARLVELSKKYGLEVDPHAKVSSLTVGQQQRVEILKALYKDCSLLVLDEPTAVLTPQETKELFVVIRNLIAENKAVIFISHKLKEVMEISHIITVLRAGKVVGSIQTEEIDAKGLANMMVGKEVLLQVEKELHQPGKVMLEVKDLHAGDGAGLEKVSGISLAVRAGEIYGIAGVDGNGQSELVRSLTGLCPKEGTIMMDGRDMSRASSKEILSMGIGHIPEDRLGMGVVTDMSIKENMIINTFEQEQFGAGIKLDWKVVESHADNLIERYRVKTPDRETTIQALSGGNQQKVVVARELDKKPRILFAVHPTRGVDVGAIEFIHKQIVSARDSGCAVILVSTELDEIMSLSDRIGVIYEGEIVGEMMREEATYEKLGLFMAGRTD